MTLDGAGFAAAVEALAGCPLRPDERLAVAVSGGPDSLALLLLAHQAFAGRVSALTVDHGLRTEAAQEAASVAAQCARLGVEHATLRWDGAKPAANLQAAARAARYRLMGEWCAAQGIAWLATAHHADDQAETLLLRLARGAGLAGLTGIRPRRTVASGVELIRPLLGVRRDDLARLIADHGLGSVDDPSNRDDRFDRTRARALLAATEWLDAERLAAVSSNLAAAEAALTWTADLAWCSRAVVRDGRVELDAGGLPRELRRRLLLRALSQPEGAAAPRGEEIERLLDRLDAGGGGTLGGTLVRIVRGRWLCVPAPPRRSGAVAP